MCASRLSLTCAHTGNPEACVCSISEDDVVDQPGFTDSDGADRCIAVAYVVHALERVSINHCQIARRQTDDSLQHTPTGCLQRARPSLSPAEYSAHCEQRL